MSLAEFEVEYAPVKYRGKDAFQVRGLNLEDVTFLAQNYLGDILKAVAEYGKSKQHVIERKNLGDFLLVLSKDFPTLTAEIISRGADEEGQVNKARSLPFMLQLTALKEILRLTTEEAGGLKNLLAVLAAALEMDQQSLRVVDDLVTRLRNTIGPSERMSASFSPTGTDSQTDIPSSE